MLQNKLKHDVFVEYVKDNQNKFYRLAYSYVKNPDDALDIVQDSIIRGLEKIHTLKNTEYLQTWFYRLMVNECMNFFRKRRRETPIENTDGIASHDGDISAGEKAMDLYAAIDKLDIKYKTVIILHYFESLNLSEVADITASPVNTVKSRLYRALDILKDEIGEDYLQKDWE